MLFEKAFWQKAHGGNCAAAPRTHDPHAARTRTRRAMPRCRLAQRGGRGRAHGRPHTTPIPTQHTRTPTPQPSTSLCDTLHFSTLIALDRDTRDLRDARARNAPGAPAQSLAQALPRDHAQREGSHEPRMPFAHDREAQRPRDRALWKKRRRERPGPLIANSLSYLRDAHRAIKRMPNAA